MIIDGKEGIEVRDAGDFVTAVDEPDLPSVYALRTKGLRSTKDSVVFERDLGMAYRHPTYPLRPHATKQVESVTGLSATPIEVTITSHGFSTGDTVYIAEVQGNKAANGKWTVTDLTPDTFSLDGSVPSGDYTEGGIVGQEPVGLVGGFTLEDIETGEEAEFVVGVSSDGKTRVYDEIEAETGKWKEVTLTLTATVDGSPGAGTYDVTVKDLLDDLGAGVTVGDHDLKGFILRNVTQNQIVFVKDNTGLVFTCDQLMGDPPGLAWQDDDELVLYASTGTLQAWEFLNGATPFLRWLPVEEQRKIYLAYSDITQSPVARRQQMLVQRAKERQYFFGITTAGVAASGSFDFGTPIDQDFILAGSGGYFEFDSTVDPLLGLGEGGKFSTMSQLIALINTLPDVSASTPGGSMIDVVARATGTAGNDLLLSGVWNTTLPGRLSGGTDEVKEALVSLPEGTYLEMAGGLIPTTVKLGSESSPIALGNAKVAVIADPPGATFNADWLRITVNGVADIGGEPAWNKVAVTCIYNGYQESDPVMRAYIGAAGVASGGQFVFRLNFAKMNKSITGLKVYSARVLQSDFPNFSDWPETADSYTLLFEIPFDSPVHPLVNEAAAVDWVLDPVTQFIYLFPDPNSAYVVRSTSIDQLSHTSTLKAHLGRETQDRREYLKPIYMARATRLQSGVVLVDQDDRTLRASHVKTGVREEGNFPNVGHDAVGNLLTFATAAGGEIMGLDVEGDTVGVLRQDELQVYDLQSSLLRTSLKIDCTSRRSVARTPAGLSYGGSRGISLLSADGTGVRMLNPRWLNFYDGSLKNQLGLPFITEEARRNTVSGFDYSFHEILVACDVATEDGEGTERIVFRYGVLTGKWNVREIMAAPTVVGIPVPGIGEDPFTFEITAQTSTTMTMEWANIPGEWDVEKFLIYHKGWRNDERDEELGFVLAAEVDSALSSFVDTKLFPGKQHQYRLVVRLTSGQTSEPLEDNAYTNPQASWDVKRSGVKRIGWVTGFGLYGWKTFVTVGGAGDPKPLGATQAEWLSWFPDVDHRNFCLELFLNCRSSPRGMWTIWKRGQLGYLTASHLEFGLQSAGLENAQWYVSYAQPAQAGKLYQFSTPVPLGEPHHWAFEPFVDGLKQMFLLYRDGLAVETLESVFKVPSGFNRIGPYDWLSTFQLAQDGEDIELDEVRYWRFLRGPELINLFWNRIIRQHEDLAARWGFDNFESSVENTFEQEGVQATKAIAPNVEVPVGDGVSWVVYDTNSLLFYIRRDNFFVQKSLGRNLLTGRAFSEPAPVSFFFVGEVVLLYPSDEAVDVEQNPLFRWEFTGVEQVIDYQLQVAADVGFTSLIFNVSGIVPRSYRPGILDSDTTHYWRVRARDADGFSNWSTAFSFTTGQYVLLAEEVELIDSVVGPDAPTMPTLVEETEVTSIVT